MSEIGVEMEPHSTSGWPPIVGILIALLIVAAVAGWAVLGEDPPPPPRQQTPEEQIIDRLDTLIVLKCRELDTIGADSLTAEEVEACS